MLTTFTVLRPDGGREHGSADLPKRPGFKRLDIIVLPIIGAPYERVRVWHNAQALDMFVDEIGALKGLQRNDAATAIYRANAMRQKPEADPETLPFVVGPAVIFDRPVWF